MNASSMPSATLMMMLTSTNHQLRDVGGGHLFAQSSENERRQENVINQATQRSHAVLADNTLQSSFDIEELHSHVLTRMLRAFE